MAEDTIPEEVDTQIKADDETELTDAEKEVVKSWTKIIEGLESDHEDHHKVIDENRKKVWGDLHKEEDAGTVRVNIPHAHIKRSVDRAYARNPEFAIRPTQFVNPGTIPMWRMFGQTAEIVLNRAFKAAEFKRRAKTCLRAAKTSRIGWLKVRWQQETKVDGEVKNRIRDTNDKIEELKRLEIEADDAQSFEEKEAALLELEELKEALEAKAEFVALQGLIFDVVDTKDILIPSKALSNFDEYVNVPYMVERIWKTRLDAERAYGKLPGGTKFFNKKTDDRKTLTSEQGKARKDNDDGDLVLFYEIWDIVADRVKILPHGGSRFVANFVPKKLGQRWYPYFALAQNPVDGQFEPLSDVELIKELADEINNSLTKFRDHRDIAVPHWLTDSNVTGEKDIKTFTHATLGEVVQIQGQPGRQLNEIMEPAKHPTIDPAVYGTSHLEAAIEKVGGGGEVTNPKSNRARTLGEAKELAADVGTGVSADTDEIEDWFEDIVQYVLEILLQRLPIDDIEGIAGPRATEEMREEPVVDPATGQPVVDPNTGQPAIQQVPTGKLIDGAVWPSKSSEEIFNNVHFVIKAGSSGKPGRQEEIQMWTQFLMPRMADLVKEVGALREQGQDGLADSLMFIGQETLKRVDPFFDINEFIPPPAPPTPEQQAQQAQQMEMQKLDLAIKRSELEQTQAETARVVADRDLKHMELQKFQADIAMTHEEIESMNLDDAVKGIMQKLEMRLKQVEVDLKREEIGLKKKELEIKSKEADNKANESNKPNEGGNNG